MPMLDTRLRITSRQQEQEWQEHIDKEDGMTLAACVCFVLMAVIIAAVVMFGVLIPQQNRWADEQDALRRDQAAYTARQAERGR